MPKRKKLLPNVQLEPAMRDKGNFGCAFASTNEDGDIILVLCCQGMNVSVAFDMEQAEEVLKEMSRTVAEELENRS